VRRHVERREATVAGSQGGDVCCCGWFDSVARAAARRVEGEEEGAEQEGACNGGVLLMKSVYLSKCEALDMRRFNSGAARAAVRSGITKGGGGGGEWGVFVAAFSSALNVEQKVGS
jgi:hypothetical protein